MWRILTGDCINGMQTLASESVQCCVTSPPYYGLRDYGTATWEGGDSACDHAASKPSRREKSRASSTLNGSRETCHASHVCRQTCDRCGAVRVDKQVGLESSPGEYVSRLVEVFREVRRVLRGDGTLWLNLGDSYTSGGRNSHGNTLSTLQSSNPHTQAVGRPVQPPGLKEKELMGIPWLVAFALSADGWYLRQDIIWHKPNPMPESVRDRCTKAHEYLFLFSKSAKYYFDADAIKEPATYAGQSRGGSTKRYEQNTAGMDCKVYDTRNKRSVWTVKPCSYKGAHFATFPPALVEPCILAGCPVGGLVLDPFTGSGTTGAVAVAHGRRFVGCELNPEYVALANERISSAVPVPSLFTMSTHNEAL